MPKFCVQFHLLGNKVIEDWVSGQNIHDVQNYLSEEIFKTQVFIVNRKEGHSYAVVSSQITHLEFLSEEQYKNRQNHIKLANMAQNLFKQ